MGTRFFKTNLALLCIIFFLVSCGGVGQEGGTATFSSTAGNYWSTSVFPVDLKVGNTFASDEVTAIDDMAVEWSDAVENKMTFFQSVTSTTNKEYTNTNNYNDGEQGVYQLNTWPSDFPTTALAVTQLFAIPNSNGGYRITHADILINEEFYNFTTNPSDFGNYDFHTVVLHELGHFLGLGHESFSVDSVMQPSVSKLDANRVTTDADRGNIAALYGLSTNYTGFATLTAGGNAPIIAASSVQSEGPVKIILQLMEDGECQHVLEGEVVHSHKLDVHKYEDEHGHNH